MITKDEIEQFQKAGVVCLRGCFREWVGTLRAGIERNQSEPGPDARIYKAEAGGTFFGDYCNWQRIPEYRKFIFGSDAAQIAKQLMGSEKVQLFHEHVLVKEPSADMPTPWHQDAPYYCATAQQTISLWLPLDDIPRERTLEFVGGSQLWGGQFRPDRFNGEALNAGDAQTPVPDIEASREDYEILGWPLQPGDAVAFDYRTLHGAPGNSSATSRRRAFSLRLLGDDAIFCRDDGIATSPPFREISLAKGAALTGEAFPVLL